ncbi:MAG: intermembrane phospholipid transport protein YdbH family protein [Erythrobacter sp.]
MALAEESPANAQNYRRYWPQRRRWQTLLVGLGVLFAALAVAWFSRERIADNIIASQLDGMGIEASYEIEAIGPRRQVLRNLVIGDPARPDLVVERVEIVPVLRWWSAGIGSVTLVRPRLRASYLDGTLSLGALDPLLEQDSAEPFELPDWKLTLVDARARLLTDYGVAGASADGSGRLDNGFRGWLAIVSPGLAGEGCRIASARLRGRVAIDDRQPEFAGPLRLSGIGCDDAGFRLSEMKIDANLRADRDLAGFSGSTKIAGRGFEAGETRLASLSGAADLDWREGLALARYGLSARSLRHPAGSLASLSGDGAVRLRLSDGRIDLDAQLQGRDPKMGQGASAAIAGWRDAASGTLVEPLLARANQALADALPGSRIEAELTYRQTGAEYALVVPTARLRNRSGQPLLSVSQFNLGQRGENSRSLAGNFSSSGAGLPALSGRMERSAGGLPRLRLQMAPYRAGGSSLSVPGLVLAQAANGAWGIAGEVRASGALPGGRIDGLSLPISGNWSEAGGLALWRRCTNLRFDSLELGGLALDRNRIALCPEGQRGIVRSTAGGMVLAARSEGLALSGSLGESPLRASAAAVVLDSRRGLAAQEVTLLLGSGDEVSRLALRNVVASFGETIGGAVEGIEGGLAAVPLEILDGAGSWQYADGALTLRDASFELRDRPAAGASARFYPLRARDASLRLSDGNLTANAALRNPASDRVVTEFAMRHDLSSGRGFADLAVPGLRFDDGLQPDQITILADGVIALADGTITGNGRIDWTPDSVISRGAFSSADFDFAAAFGPVQRVSGTIAFSDLLGMTTDGTQRLNIGSINPGVEVFDGTFDFALRDGTNVSIKGGRWPFFGGTMELRPTELNLAVSEVRRYVIEISGADAAQFIASMELGNISATGLFDGTVPLVFDEMGNGEIRNGLLISRPPGGNLSYVGDLTYEDMGAIANFAFQSLRSLDFNQMMVEMNGPLTGEIITRLLFDGVRQGEGASSNLITRQVAKLPIRFNVNIRAAFYELLTSLRGMYDPAFVRDPRELGLFTVENGRFVRQPRPAPPAIKPEDVTPDEPAIQPHESEPLP